MFAEWDEEEEDGEDTGAVLEARYSGYESPTKTSFLFVDRVIGWTVSLVSEGERSQYKDGGCYNNMKGVRVALPVQRTHF